MGRVCIYMTLADEVTTYCSFDSNVIAKIEMISCFSILFLTLNIVWKNAN